MSIGTSTSIDPLSLGTSVSVTFASNGTCCAIWYDGTNVKMSYASSPYTSWTSSTVSAAGGIVTSARLDTSDTVNLILYVSGGLSYVPITLSGTTYSVGSLDSIATVASGGNNLMGCLIDKDAQGRYWAVATDRTGANINCYESATPTTASWTNNHTVAWSSDVQNNFPAGGIVGNYFLIIYPTATSSFFYQRVDNHSSTIGSWSTATAFTPGGSSPTYDSYFSFRGNSTVGVEANSSGSGIWARVYTASSDTWATAVQLSSTANDTKPTVIAGSDGNFYVVWMSYSAANNYAIVYKKYTVGTSTWDTSATTLVASGANNVNPVGGSNNNKIGVLYQTGTASPYTVNFASISLGSVVDHSWSMRGRVCALTNHNWQMRGRVSTVTDHNWQMRGRVGSAPVDHNWQIRGRVGALTNSHRWQMRGRVSTATSHLWQMRGNIGNTTAHEWQMRGRLSGVADHRWQMRGNVAILTNSHRWQMRGSVGAPVSHRWSMRGRVSSGPIDHTWQIRGRVGALTDHAWSMRARVANLVAHRWQMRGVIGTNGSPHIWAMRGRVASGGKHFWTMRGNVGTRIASGGFALFANGSGTASFDSFRVTAYPDPSLVLTNVGRATTSLVNWNASAPTNTSLAVKTSLDNGITWSSVASSGNAIPGIALQPGAVIDTFASANYTQSNFGGTTGTWTWDTTNGRLIGSGGNGGTLVNTTALTGADNLIAPDFDQCDGSGLIANYQSASAMYYVQLWDASGTGTQNAVKLFKRSGGVSTQLGSTATIDWPRGRYRRFILDVEAGVLTVSMDGVALITYTDGSPLAAGQSGLLLGTLLRCVELRIQQYGQNVSALSVCTQLTLSTTDPTVTPQVLDLQTFVSSSDIDPGALIPSAKYLRTYLSDNANDLNTQSATTWWYVRPDKSVVFQQRTASPAPWILDSANSTLLGNLKQGDLLVANLKLTNSGDLYRNRQILTGVQATGLFSEIRVGDGSTRTWNLSHELAAPPTITLNGQPVTVGVKGVDLPGSKQFYYQLGSVAIDQDSSQTLLEEGDTLAFPNYSGTFTAEVVRDNAVAGTFAGTLSQAELADIDQTSGIVENVLDVSKMNLDIPGAEAYGDQLLAQYGFINARTLSFDTLRPGLLPGMDLPVYVPEQQCVAAHMLVTDVGITGQIAPAVPGGVLYRYSVVATEGPALGSPVKLLSSLFK